MKNKYSIIWRILIIITSTVVSPIVIHSQDLSDEQRKERCQNNKNRIAELETQLQVINMQLAGTMTNKEIEDTRSQMVLVRSMKEPRNYDVTRLRKIENQYNFKIDTCLKYYDFLTKEDFNECLTKLENIIARKINRAIALNRPEILSKKNEIDKQLAFHRNNLLALGCDERSITETYDPKSVAGTWNWFFAPPGQTLVKHGTVTFVKKSDNSGTMTWDGGSNGLWTQNGLTVTITWQNNPSVDNMTLSQDGHNLSGKNNKGWVVEGTRGVK